MRTLISLIACTVLLNSCGVFFNQPMKTKPARLGENTEQYSYLKDLPRPTKKVIASVYKFRDQTGQYKDVTNGGSSFSTAVTQGATSILLKAMEDSGWFVTIERENQNNLLSERQLIRSSQQQFMAENPEAQVPILPPLLYADVLLEGGIISYDSNVITGGSGLRYFGAGASTQYREDRVTVYLRAVSTRTGEIFSTIYTSKTVLSQAIDGNLFRYVKLRRLLEAETGVTYNEPAHLAVTEAIEKALYSLIIEGLEKNNWTSEQSDEELETYFAEYAEEKEISDNTLLLDRYINRSRRAGFGLHLLGAGNILDGDFSNANLHFGIQAGAEVFFSDNLAISSYFNSGKLSVENGFETAYNQLDLMSRYIILPHEELTPYVKLGGSLYMPNPDQGDLEQAFSFKYAGGIEYLLDKRVGLILEGGQNIFFTDEIDQLVNGKRDDFIWNINGGLSFYFTNKIEQ